LDFLLQLVQALAWPLVVLGILVIYRKPLGEFLIEFGRRVSKFSVYQISVELAPTKQAFPIPAEYGGLNSHYFYSTADEMIDLFELNGTAYDYAVFDLGDGRNWLTSRLFIFAMMLERMSEIRCCVFLESSGAVEKQFVCTASPNAVRWALAQQYSWLEVAYAQVYAQVYADYIPPGRSSSTEDTPRPAIAVPPAESTLNDAGPDAPSERKRRSPIRSARGALSSERAGKIVFEFLKHPFMQEKGPIPPTNTDDWVLLGDEGTTYYEHARWLDANVILHDLRSVLGREAALGSRSNGAFEQKEVQRINKVVLAAHSNFVAVSDRQGRFLQLIERQDLLERLIGELE
jgi:hypothetical protein